MKGMKIEEGIQRRINMTDKNLYYQLWQKYLPVIALQMKNAIKGGAKEIKMSKIEFEKYGNRKASDYVFNLEIKDSKLFNNIGGTAVARDLFDMLLTNNSVKELFIANNYKISLGKEFILNISIL
jgi:hypothetical protein